MPLLFHQEGHLSLSPDLGGHGSSEGGASGDDYRLLSKFSFRACEHGRNKYTCKECGGSAICKHNREKYQCKDCGGSSFCDHGRRKSICRDCGGSHICEHDRQRSRCKDCGGSGICEHNRRGGLCKDCGGSGICAHGRQKYYCKECKSLRAASSAGSAVPPRAMVVASRKRARAADHDDINTTPTASLLDVQTGPTAPLAYIAHLFEQRRLKLEREAEAAAAAAEAALAPPHANFDVSGSAAAATSSTADKFDEIADDENSSLSCIDETCWDQEDVVNDKNGA